MKNLRLLLGVLILASLALVGGIVWYATEPFKGKMMSPKEPASAADLKLDRVRYTETRQGVKEWELEADSATYFKDQNTVNLEKVKATFFGKNRETYVLVGKKGKFNTQTKEIEVFLGVQIDSSDGYRMRTQSLKYQPDKRELSTPDRVEMSGPQFHVDGIGLIVELDRQRLKVLSQVTTTLSRFSLKDSFGLAS